MERGNQPPRLSPDLRVHAMTHVSTVAHMHTKARDSYSKSGRIIRWHIPLAQGAPCVEELGQVTELEPDGKQYRKDLFAQLVT